MEKVLKVSRTRNRTYIVKSSDGKVAVIYSARTKIEDVLNLLRQIQLVFAETGKR